MLYTISGYWKDDKDKFDGYLVNEYDDVPNGYSEDDIFYELGKAELDDAIAKGNDTTLDFVVTSYEVA